MTPEKAIQLIRKEFPFAEHMNPGQGVYRNIVKTVLRYLKPGDKILDFGAGPCDKTAVMSLLGFKCVAFDDLQDDWHKIEGNRKKIFAFAKKFNICYKTMEGNEFTFKKGEFDMIVVNDVLEHLHDSPRDLINDLLQFVRPEGYLFVTVPNAVNLRKRIAVFFGKTNLPSFENYYWYPGKWRGHVREYVKDDLERLSEYLNLEVLELRSCHHMISKLPSFARPIFILLTSIFPGWRDSWLLVAKKKLEWKSRKSIHKVE